MSQQQIMANSVVRPSTRCWVWTAAITNIGYGRVRLSNPRRLVSAHRASYEAFNGPIPEGKLVLHSCDNMKCVNPEHLRIGTQSENIKESWDKGRQVGRWGHRRI